MLIFAQQEDTMIHPVTYELIKKGKELAGKLCVNLHIVLLGFELEKEALELKRYDVDKIFLYDDPSLEEFDVIKYSRNIVGLVEEVKPEIFLIGGTRIGRTLAPRIAACLKTGFITVTNHLNKEVAVRVAATDTTAVVAAVVNTIPSGTGTSRSVYGTRTVGASGGLGMGGIGLEPNQFK